MRCGQQGHHKSDQETNDREQFNERFDPFFLGCHIHATVWLGHLKETRDHEFDFSLAQRLLLMIINQHLAESV